MPQRRLRITGLLVFALIAAAFAGAQQVQPPAALALKNLSDGAAPLDGTWQFHPGDDPGWAAPGFDDSRWEQISADKPWGEQNHPGYTGFAWYRRHILTSTARDGSALALMVRHIDDAYEIYWNGQLIGRNGEFPPHAAWYPLSQPPQTFGWPSAQNGVMAIRVWKAPLSSEDDGSRGGFAAPIMAGTPAAIQAAKARLDYAWLRTHQVVFGEDLLYALVTFLGLLAWLRFRHQWPLLWMSTFALATVCRQLLYSVGLTLPMTVSNSIASPLSSLRDISLWFLLLTLLRLRDRSSLVRLTQIFAVISFISTLADGYIAIFLWSSGQQSEVQLLDAAMTGLYIITATLPLALVVFAFSRHRQLDAAPRVVAVFAFVSGMIQVISNVAPQGSRYTHWTLADKITGPLFAINGNSVNLVSLAGILLLISIVFAVYRNSLDARRRQIALEQEFRDARELQQVLIPETPKTLPGFEITSSYLPAAEVGGDFLQLIPAVRDHEGATLAVIGDVSGKGLRAAMSVALIVGAVRTLAESTSRPAEILDGLNRRLCGRMQGGFVTCLIMRLHPDGSCVLANAGHPPPFINDREMELSGALPLGLISEISYNEIRFRLEENDRLTLYTDGLLEARNRAGEIYGFARMQTLLKTRPTAAQAAQAAVDFGQDDDTTVLTLTRL